MTARQLSIFVEMERARCSYVLWELQVYELLQCLNPEARRSRLYWLTSLGRECQERLREQEGQSIQNYDLPPIDWKTYGWLCFTYRSAVVQVMEGPMQSAAIKRRIRFSCPRVRISANNVRDVMRDLLTKHVVKEVRIRRKAHRHFELTEEGKAMKEILLRC